MAVPRETSEGGNVPEDVLKVADIRRKTGWSPQRIYALMRSGALPSVRVGGRIVVPVPAWEKWLQQQANAAMGNLREADAR